MKDQIKMQVWLIKCKTDEHEWGSVKKLVDELVTMINES